MPKIRHALILAALLAAPAHAQGPAIAIDGASLTDRFASFSVRYTLQADALTADGAPHSSCRLRFRQNGTTHVLAPLTSPTGFDFTPFIPRVKLRPSQRSLYPDPPTADLTLANGSGTNVLIECLGAPVTSARFDLAPGFGDRIAALPDDPAEPKPKLTIWRGCGCSSPLPSN